MWVYHDFFCYPDPVNVSWSGSGTGPIIRIRSGSGTETLLVNYMQPFVSHSFLFPSFLLLYQLSSQNIKVFLRPSIYPCTGIWEDEWVLVRAKPPTHSHPLIFISRRKCLQLWNEGVCFREAAKKSYYLRKDTHKKSVFFSGRTTKVLSSLH